jgi:hypothetical protein
MKENCNDCKHSWYHEHDIGEVVNIGKEGWVCDGASNGNVANLKSFPFQTKQKCFEPKIGPLNCINPKCPWDKFTEDAKHCCSLACVGMFAKSREPNQPPTL